MFAGRGVVDMRALLARSSQLDMHLHQMGGQRLRDEAGGDGRSWQSVAMAVEGALHTRLVALGLGMGR